MCGFQRKPTMLSYSYQHMKTAGDIRAAPGWGAQLTGRPGRQGSSHCPRGEKRQVLCDREISVTTTGTWPQVPLTLL